VDWSTLVSDASTTAPTVEELAAMSTEEAMIAGAEVDGVHVINRRDPFPIPGTKAEKRAERTVASMFVLAFLSAVGFIVVFAGAVPFDWHLPGEGDQNFQWFTPLLGLTLTGSLGFLGVGIILWVKLLMPHEYVIQERHDGPSDEVAQIMTAATLIQGFEDTGLARRGMINGTLGLAIGAFSALPLVATVGAFIRKPNKGVGNSIFHTWYGEQLPQYPNGVPLIHDDGRRVSPDDLLPGSIATVFPAGHVRESDSPTLLIRLRPGQKVKSRVFKGVDQATYQWGDFVAYSKICTHAGCPASLFEQQTGRLLCPCHQSQFDLFQDARPVFGPATRSLPKLPLGVEVVDGRQYFVAKGDFPEAIGPAFWERP